MSFLYLKALHIIFVVTWFSGLFYLCRLFVYNRETADKEEPERNILQQQFNLMIKRLLLGITWPSAVLTLIFGPCLLFQYPVIPGWLWIKMGLVLLLLLYHLSLHLLYKQQVKGLFLYTSQQLRLWNEVPTLFLVAIVMLVVVRQEISMVYGTLGILALALMIGVAIRIYKQLRRQ